MTSNPQSRVLQSLRKKILHSRYTQARSEILNLTPLNSERSGLIIPFLGPTRCGKTEILDDLKNTLGCEARSGSLFGTSDFVLGKVPPIPNGKSLNGAILEAIGLRVRPTETTSSIRSRLFSAIQADRIQTIAMDECNHLAERGTDLSARTAADQFKSLVDNTGVTLILSGLPRFQKIIDANEQFRDRSTKTVEFLPYNWSIEADRDAFFGAFLAVLDCFEANGIAVELDEEDCVRRLYGATSGRVGMMLRIFSATARMMEEGTLRLQDISNAGMKLLQVSTRPDTYFGSEVPSDPTLVRSYVKLVSEAGLDFSPSNPAELSAVVSDE